MERYTGARHCIAVASGTDALTIILKAAGIGVGDEVIVPSYSFFATASTVIHVGGIPVFIDVLPGSYAIDPTRVEEAITPDTKAIMVVHLFSQMADMGRLSEIAERHGLIMLEDSAEAIGMRVAGRHAGRWGRAGALSFFPTKTLGAFGDAGMVLTDDAEMALRVRSLANGSDADGAWASRCDELAAAVLLFRMNGLDEEITARGTLAARYSTKLTGIPEVVIPNLADPLLDQEPVWYVYVIQCERRDELQERLGACGVETEVYYPRPLSRQPCFDPTNSRSYSVPVCECASTKALALPLYPDMSTAQVDKVCAIVRSFYGASDVRS